MLLLENTSCLSDAEVEAVRRFAEGGGGLVATGWTSLMDDEGNPRRDFALRDLLGASYLGLTPFDSGYDVIELDHGASGLPRT